MSTALLDPATEHAAQVFLERIAGRYRVVGAILFGSRARHTQRADSDADLAVLLPAPHGERIDVAIDMAGIAFDVLLDTGILIQALPLWEDEFDHPESFSNPRLIESILNDGVRLSVN